MFMISKYNTFLGERLFESVVNESMIYYTKEFKDALKKLSSKSPIAKALLDVEYSDVKPDMTFIGMSDKEGYFSFTQIKKAINSIKKSLEELVKNNNIEPGSDTYKGLEGIWKKIENGETSQSDVNHLYNNEPWNLKDKARNDAKIAKLVNQIFPDKYTNKEVEEFTNLFKKVGDTESEFVLVKGEDIRYWYDQRRYEVDSGDLGNSCMRYSRCASYLDIYVENPEVCSLLILKSEDGNSIKGRTLIWKITDIDIEGVEYYMDRIYAIDDATKLMFQQYADEKGWLKRLNSNYSDCQHFKLGDEEYRNYEATIQLKKWKYDYYPYMDTFKKLEKSGGLLINDEDEDVSGYYILTRTDGGYEDTSGKWSHWFDERIPEEDAIWSEPLDSWIWREDTIEVEVGSRRYRGVYPEDYDDVVRDCVTGNFIHTDDSYFSEWYDDYFLAEDEIEVITWISDDSDMKNCNTSTETLSDQDSDLIDINKLECSEYLSKFDHDSDMVAGAVLTKSKTTGKYYFNDHTVQVFKTEKGNFISNDCIALGIKTDSKNSYYTDIFTYNYNMDKSTKQNIIKALKEKINSLENLISGKQTRLVFNEPGQNFLDDEPYINANKSILYRLRARLNELEDWV